MSCVELTPEMTALLAELTDGIPTPTRCVELKATPEFAQARDWGWVMVNGELTGTGWVHTSEPGMQPRGILPP